MHLKDYYSILDIKSSATLPEIKKAYRKLAQQVHPDKKQDDPYAAVQFAEIKEAYEVLTNPAKKEYYLQQRWFNQQTGRRKSQDNITPVTVLLQALELEKYVSRLDVFRMDKEGLKEYILGLLSDSTVEQLKKFRETETNRQVNHTILKTLHSLAGHSTKEIVVQLYKLTEGDEIALQQLAAYTQETEKKNWREKYSLIIILAATLILCLLIYLAGR